jgi:hypothetical protein
MNGTPQENEAHAVARKRIEELVAALRLSAPRLVQDAEELTGKILRKNIPIIQASAVQSGHMSGRLSLEVSFDLTPGKGWVQVRGHIQPPPISSVEKKSDVREPIP